jgi:hypothetical protein
MNLDRLGANELEKLLDLCSQLSEHGMSGVCEFNGYTGLALYQETRGIPLPIALKITSRDANHWDQAVLAGLTPTAALAALVSGVQANEVADPCPTGAILKFGANHVDTPHPLVLVAVGPPLPDLVVMCHLSVGVIWMEFQHCGVVDPGTPLRTEFRTFHR